MRARVHTLVAICSSLLLVAMAGAMDNGAALPSAEHRAGVSALVIDKVEGSGWRAEGVHWTLDAHAARGPRAILEIDAVELPEPVGVLRHVRLVCPSMAIEARGARCEGARGHFLRRERAHAFDIELQFDAARARWQVTIPAFPIGDAAVQVGLVRDAAGIMLRLRADAVPLETLSPLGPLEFFSGEADVKLDIGPGLDGPGRAIVAIRNAAFSDPSGRYAAEGLGVTLAATGRFEAGQWRGRTNLNVTAGGAYAEPVYLDFERFPLTVETRLAVAGDARRIRLEDIVLEQPNVLRITGALVDVVEGAIESAEVELTEATFPAAYDTYLAGALVGTPLAQIDVVGTARGRLSWAAGRPRRVHLELDGINIEERQGRFALYGADGEVNWADSGIDAVSSALRFGGGFLYGAGFDETQPEFGMAGEAVDLLEPARIPLLGGALEVRHFSLRDYGSDDLALRFEADLEPIDLGQLTLALDWPPFAGTLAGRLPLLTYKNGVVTVGGNLEARAFDGDITIEGLRIEQPLSLVPRLAADIRLRNLDLEQVTQIVPFGRVSGRLDGDIVGLRLLKGEPVAFDARFHTPEDDDSRHRLSQRAVDTIARVAGGGAVLSSTFLRVFKHFAYDKLGIGCRLQNDVCLMDGVEAADGGYYIVKGALLPRVDLIGRVREVKWSRLMAQLREALAEGEFRIE